MIRRLSAALLSAIALPTFAFAQALVGTAPANDNTRKAASAAFVQKLLAGRKPFSPNPASIASGATAFGIGFLGLPSAAAALNALGAASTSALGLRVPVGQDVGVTTAATDQSAVLASGLSSIGGVSLLSGSYTLTTPLAIPADTELTLRPRASFAISGGGSLSLGAGARYEDHAYGGTKDQEAVVRALGATRPGGGQDAFGLDLYADPVFMRAVASDTANAGSGFIADFAAIHNFGGATTSGGRLALYGVLNQTASTSSSNTNRNYVGMGGAAITRSGDGGTDLGSGAKGAYFGQSGYCQVFSGTNILECAGAELNTYLAPGTSARIVAAVSAVGMHNVQGSDVDAAFEVGFGTQFGGTPKGFRHGLLFDDLHSANPLSTDGTLIGSKWVTNTTTARTIYAGLDMRGFSPTMAGVIGKQTTGGGKFLELMDSTASTDLFAVDQLGHVQTVGLRTRSGTDGSVGGNYYNLNWNGSSMDLYIDVYNVGMIETRVAAPAASSSACLAGVTAYDASYEYRCVAANHWQRWSRNDF